MAGKKVNKMINKKANKKVIVYCFLALICMALTFMVDWLFIIPAVVLVWLNQKELMRR